jgi:5-methylcytosine-specific restriction endonuclease McrA
VITRGRKSRLDDGVLILNRSWLAVHIASVKRAVCLMALGHARAVDPADFNTYDFDGWTDLSEGGNGDCIHAVSFLFRVPEIIVLTGYDGRQSRGLKLSRRNVMERDEYTCQYCGRRLEPSKLTIDHVIPKSRGGQTVWENVVAACMRCNDRKGDRTPEKADMKLARVPRRPRWVAGLGLRRGYARKESWQRFLAGTPGGGVIVA